MPQKLADGANFSGEITDGQNARNVKCQFCSSLILSPASANFESFEFDLPLIKQQKSKELNPETEKIAQFWSIEDMFTFQNVGFSHTVGSTKYLACADCEAGPIGYHDLTTKKSYVALTRVFHS